QIITEPSLEPEPGDAERTVLVIELEITRVVCGFRDAPGYTSLAAVIYLARNYRVIGLIQKSLGITAHYQQRHEVLEHRRRPGYQRPASVDLSQLPPEMEPVLLRH